MAGPGNTPPEDAAGAAAGGDDEDPRRQRSRSRLLDAATGLLTSGGIDAVTIEAVTRASKVARTTLYRHFRDSTALITAAFEHVLPPVSGTAPEGTARDRLVALVDEIATSLDDAPMHLTMLGWLTIGSGRPDQADGGVDSLRARVIDQYRGPLDALLDSPEVRCEIGDHDNTLTMLQLIGPLVFARLLAIPPIGPDQRARIVDDFLAARARENLENAAPPQEQDAHGAGESDGARGGTRTPTSEDTGT